MRLTYSGLLASVFERRGLASLRMSHSTKLAHYNPVCVACVVNTLRQLKTARVVVIIERRLSSLVSCHKMRR